MCRARPTRRFNLSLYKVKYIIQVPSQIIPFNLFNFPTFLPNCVTYVNLEIKVKCKILLIEYMEPHQRYAFVSVSGIIYAMKLTISIEKKYDLTLKNTSSSQFSSLKQLVEEQVCFVRDMVSSYLRYHLSIFDRHLLVIFRSYQTRNAQGNIQIQRMFFKDVQKKLEDTKRVIRIVYRKRTDHTTVKGISTKGQTKKSKGQHLVCLYWNMILNEYLS